MAKIIIVWGLWGPYHCGRLEAFRKLGQSEGHEVVGVSLFSGSRVNKWRAGNLPEGVVHFDLGQDESRLPVFRTGTILSLPKKLCADVALLPSYYHWSLVLNLGVRLAGGRVVMMNETHGGTAKARGFKAVLKRAVVSRFDAALVGGQPQMRYFASLGIPPEKIFPGYDAVDNDYFSRKADEVRAHEAEFRRKYELPEHYFLSVGRFVGKKNLGTLIQAYRKFLEVSSNCQTHLALVGSGEEEPRLRRLCSELNLPVCDHSASPAPAAPRCAPIRTPAVHFYGFRQIEENPIFYALADAFILPSLWEEWGLVVNEAMASGLPVVVSEAAGCAEDLLEPGCPAGASLEERTWIGQYGLAGKLRLNGLVFNPHSVNELTRSLQIIERSSNLRALMGAESRRIVEKCSCRNFAVNALRTVRVAMGERPFKIQAQAAG